MHLFVYLLGLSERVWAREGRKPTPAPGDGPGGEQEGGGGSEFVISIDYLSGGRQARRYFLCPAPLVS